MSWSPEASPVHQGSYQVGSTNDEEHYVPQVGRQGAPQLMIRAGGIPLGGQNAQQCDEVFWGVTEDIQILPRHCVDLGVAGASTAV